MQIQSIFVAPLASTEFNALGSAFEYRFDILTVITLTGNLILFVDVCTNFVHKEVDGFSG